MFSFIFGYETRHRSFKIPHLEAHGGLWRFTQAGLTPTNREFVRFSPSLCKTAKTALKDLSDPSCSVAQGWRDAHSISSAKRRKNARFRSWKHQVRSRNWPKLSTFWSSSPELEGDSSSSAELDVSGTSFGSLLTSSPQMNYKPQVRPNLRLTHLNFQLCNQVRSISVSRHQVRPNLMSKQPNSNFSTQVRSNLYFQVQVRPNL